MSDEPEQERLATTLNDWAELLEGCCGCYAVLWLVAAAPGILMLLWYFLACAWPWLLGLAVVTAATYIASRLRH